MSGNELDQDITVPTELAQRAVDGTQKDWAETLRAVIISTNMALGTRALVRYTPTESLRRVRADIGELSAAITAELDERHEKGDDGFDQAMAAKLVDLGTQLRDKSRERFETWWKGEDPDADKERYGQYL